MHKWNWNNQRYVAYKYMVIKSSSLRSSPMYWWYAVRTCPNTYLSEPPSIWMISLCQNTHSSVRDSNTKKKSIPWDIPWRWTVCTFPAYPHRPRSRTDADSESWFGRKSECNYKSAESHRTTSKTLHRPPPRILLSLQSLGFSSRFRCHRHPISLSIRTCPTDSGDSLIWSCYL